MDRDTQGFDIAEIRRRLEDRRGPSFWRGLEEVAQSDAFRRFVEAEFPAAAPLLSETSRRDFLRVMAASMALAGLTGCGGPPDEAVPYVEQPEMVVPGKPRYYATAALFEGFAQPVLAETHVGRPTKLEGNPQHPMSGGATDAFTQAAVLQLYDPDRSQAPRFQGRISTWAAHDTTISDLRARLAGGRGAGLRLLTGAVTSPTLVRQIEALAAQFPGMRRHLFEPAGPGSWPAARLAFGRALDRHYRLDRAAVVLSLDEDLLGPGPEQVRHARGWAARRRLFRTGGDEALLYVAESTPSLTGSVATGRRAVGSGRIPAYAAALARELGLPVPSGATAGLPARDRIWIAERAAELAARRGRSLIAVGSRQPPEIQALAYRLNERLGNLGTTLFFTEPVALAAGEDESLPALAEDMGAGRVEALVILEANPAYTAPADLDFAALLERVPLRIHAGLYYDETAALCHWHAPLTHPLESWTDARAVDGTATVLQPLVRPFYSVRSVHEVAAGLSGEMGASAYDIVRETWRPRLGPDFETRWRQALHDGLVPGTAARPVPVSTRAATPSPVPDAASATADADTVEIVFRPDPAVWDGRFANLGWLQELPKPLTKVTWDNVAAVSPAVAERLALENGEMVEVRSGGRSVFGPAWIMPGQADSTVALFLGYGRRRAGRVGDGIGYDAYELRTTESPWRIARATVLRAPGRAVLATTQLHFSLEGRDLVRATTVEELRMAAGPPPEGEEVPPSLYPPWHYDSPSWGMAIDLDACIGCNACVVACQAENNVPVVGKEQVAIGREMHWLRVDRYYAGPVDTPETYFQPVPCMHCEKAPCEVGCPVNATVHGPEGLNAQIYNRCIGTRTCSSYCPYKVRRFNWYDYTGEDEPSLQAARNPDVTVRGRGVMEKCTYCVQRISAARIEAEKEDRPIREGEVKTACQAVCPTRAITFGNIKDPDSAVSRAKRSSRNYSLLEELDTRPRTSYLARVRARGPGDDGEEG